MLIIFFFCDFGLLNFDLVRSFFFRKLDHLLNFSIYLFLDRKNDLE